MSDSILASFIAAIIFTIVLKFYNFMFFIWSSKHDYHIAMEHFKDIISNKFDTSSRIDVFTDNKIKAHQAEWSSYYNFLVWKIAEMNYFEYALLVIRLNASKISLRTYPPYGKKDKNKSYKWTINPNTLDKYDDEFREYFKTMNHITYDKYVEQFIRVQFIVNTGKLEKLIHNWDLHRYSCENHLLGLLSAIDETIKNDEELSRFYGNPAT